MNSGPMQTSHANEASKPVTQFYFLLSGSSSSRVLTCASAVPSTPTAPGTHTASSLLASHRPQEDGPASPALQAHSIASITSFLPRPCHICCCCCLLLPAPPPLPPPLLPIPALPPQPHAFNYQSRAVLPQRPKLPVPGGWKMTGNVRHSSA